MKQKWVKVLVIVVVVIVVLLLLAFVAIRVMLNKPLPDYSGTIYLDGLSGTVEIYTDDYGVPHIFAQNEEDLFFAQGYITARERLFQMDTTRLAGRGELSTYFGEATVGADKFFKTLGFYRTAKLEYQTLDADSRVIVDAYVKGVNAYIESAKAYSIEYTLLGVKPEPWKAEDTLVGGLLMAYSLNRSKDIELTLYQIGQKAGAEVLDLIIPTLPDYAPKVSSAIGNLKTADNTRYYPPAGQEASAQISDHWFNPVSLDIPASNWMIFHGSRTTTGNAVFTGSPDLEPQIPALFYLVRLSGGEFDVIGGSIPGVPGVNVLGFNRNIAWSTVNGRGDEMDFYIEQLNPDNPNQYLTEEGYEEFELIEELLKVKTKEGFAEEKFEIRVSRHGPIISEVMPGAPENCAMKWVGHQTPTKMLQGLIGLMRADDFDQFRQALSLMRTPTLGFGYADVRGNIGYQFVMSVPLREKGDGTIPVPGSSGEYGWSGFVPFEELPYDFNPDKGYLASFNTKPMETDYHISNYFMFERALRFEEIVGEKDQFTPEEIRQMQLDNVSVVAKRWVPEILKACSDIGELETVVALLEEWDYAIAVDSPQALIFNAFYINFMVNVLEDQLGEELAAEMVKPYIIYQPDMLLANIIDESDHFLFDDQRTPDVRESKEEMIRISMFDAVNELNALLGSDLAKWQWGNLHMMNFKHPLGEQLGFFNLKPIPMSGDATTINAGLMDSHDDYKMTGGGVIRLVVDMSDLGSATFISPPGQSGLYGSKHYSNQAALWAEGGQIPANFLNARELPNLLVLEPVK